jgi:hypothetical protein
LVGNNVKITNPRIETITRYCKYFERENLIVIYYLSALLVDKYILALSYKMMKYYEKSLISERTDRLMDGQKSSAYILKLKQKSSAQGKSVAN